MAGFETNLYDALRMLESNRANLHRYASMLSELASATGGKVSCKLVDTYNRSVNEYMSFGRKVFDLVHKNKMAVEQVVFDKNGKPQLDQQGNVRTLRINGPLPPPRFQLPVNACPNAVRANVGQVEIGVLPALAAIPLAKLAVVAIGSILVVGVGGYYTHKILREARLWFTQAPDWNPAVAMGEYEKCVVESKKAGIPPAQISTNCGKLLDMPSGGSSTTTIMLGLAGAIVAGMFIMKKGS